MPRISIKWKKREISRLLWIYLWIVCSQSYSPLGLKESNEATIFLNIGICPSRFCLLWIMETGNSADTCTFFLFYHKDQHRNILVNAIAIYFGSSQHTGVILGFFFFPLKLALKPFVDLLPRPPKLHSCVCSFVHLCATIWPLFFRCSQLLFLLP